MVRSMEDGEPELCSAEREDQQAPRMGGRGERTSRAQVLSTSTTTGVTASKRIFLSLATFNPFPVSTSSRRRRSSNEARAAVWDVSEETLRERVS